MAKPARESSQVRADRLLLVGITVASALPYLAGLDFYSDDWDFLAIFLRFAPDGWFQSLQVGVAKFPPRPGHGALIAGLITAFGTNPLPFHLLNLAVCSAFVVLLYATLVSAGLDRATSFAVAALFIVWPQLSTVRVWFAAFQIPLSGVFFLVSTLIELELARSPGRHPLRKAASLAALAASLSLDEIFAIPALLVAILLGWRQLRDRSSGPVAKRLARTLPLAINVALIIVALKLKGTVSTRGITSLSTFLYLLEVFLSPAYRPSADYGINLPFMLRHHFVAVPWSVAIAPPGLISDPGAPAAFAAAVAVGLMTAGRLFRPGETTWTMRQAFVLVVGGLVAFFAGYAIFLVSQRVGFSLAGIGNRTAFAATIGVALVIVGALRGVTLGAGRTRNAAFALAVAAIAALATLRSAEIGCYWARADDVRRERLATAGTDLAGLPDGAVVLLDGFAPISVPPSCSRRIGKPRASSRWCSAVRSRRTRPRGCGSRTTGSSRGSTTT